jgi:hypothetical protein
MKTYLRASSNPYSSEMAWVLATSANMSMPAWGQAQLSDSRMPAAHTPARPADASAE